MTTTTYLGSGDVSKHRRDYRPEWLGNLADDVTIEGSVLTGLLRDRTRSGQSSALPGREPGRVIDRTMEVLFGGAGAEAYVFTFG